MRPLVLALVATWMLSVVGHLAANQEPLSTAPVVTGDGVVHYPSHDSAEGPVSPPTVRKTVTPKYTKAARAAKIEGVVHVKAVVEPDGHVDRVSVIKSLDAKFGLDDEAVKAAKAWRFYPSKRDGKPVAAWVQLLLEFRLASDQQ